MGFSDELTSILLLQPCSLVVLLFLAQSLPVVFVVVFCFIALLSLVDVPWNASSTLLNYYLP